jgi:hypothetical protein
MIGSDSHYLPVALKQLMRYNVLTTTGRHTGSPKTRDSSKDRPWVLGQGMKRR